MNKEIMAESDITVIITSCGRYDLLRGTLDSFFRYNTDRRIREIIVVEDGEGDPSALCAYYGVRMLRLGRRLGQIGAIDAAYAEVTTPFIFHIEDDWEFYRPSFIEPSRQLLMADPTIVCVWLRAWDDTNGHPIAYQSSCRSFGTMATDFNGWRGFTFNPGLRRFVDYQRLGRYSTHVTFDGGAMAEFLIGGLYYELGFHAAILNATGFVRHTGGDRHVPWSG